MTHLRTLLPAGSDMILADHTRQVTPATLAGLVTALQDRLAREGLAGARLCLPLDSSLGALAVLLAVLGSRASAALIPRPTAAETPDWPGFCQAVLLPPELPTEGDFDPVAVAGNARLIRLAGQGGAQDEDRVYLRTSGTTGAPKWAVHDTGALLENARACVTRLELSAAERVMIPVPIHHMYGLGAALLPALLAGASIALVPRGNPLEIHRAQRAFDPTTVFLVPSQCRSIMALNRGIAPRRLTVLAGDKLSPDEAAAFEAGHGPLVSLYGSTELGAITAGRPGDPAELRHRTAGPPMDGVTLALEPAEPAQDEAQDGALPMRVRHGAGLLGYADAQGGLAAPAPAVWATGDLVKLHEGDRVEILGRADHAVNRDGLLVHMGEIEACLARARGVGQAAVVAAGQSRRGAGLAAFCTLARHATATEDSLLAHCRAHLPARAVPDRIELLETLPMLASGKIDRRRLTDRATPRQS